VQDEMLPPEQMRELFDIAKRSGAKDLTWVQFDYAHHMGECLLRSSKPFSPLPPGRLQSRRLCCSPVLL